MNTGLFQQAQAQYVRADYEGALNSFYGCLQDQENIPAAGEVGRIYHQIGNCLIKLHDFEGAIQAYAEATQDSEYSAIGAVNCNLGNCYAALHDYEDAVKHFEIALSDPAYDTPYKAYSGLGKAHLKLGQTAEAGSAFRSAALDEANPNPAQALLNLGICFMVLNRPHDAVRSYESALQFPMSDATKNKLYANLGQAYTSTGQMQQAVNAFETALADKTYFLNDAASVDYQRAVGAVAQGTAVIAPVGEATPVAQPENDMSGFDVMADGSTDTNDPYQTQAIDPVDAQYDAYAYAAADVQDGYATSEERFYNASEEEIAQWSKKVARQERKHRNVGLKIFVTIAIIILLLLGAAVLAYWQGFGFPTQESLAKQLFANKSQASSLFVSDLSQDKVQSITDPVVEDADATVEGIDRSMNTSVVYVLAHTSEGGDIHYKVTMSRDGIGWKISNVEVFFPSQS